MICLKIKTAQIAQRLIRGRSDAKLLAQLVVLLGCSRSGESQRLRAKVEELIVAVPVISRHRCECLTPLAIVHRKSAQLGGQVRAAASRIGLFVAEMGKGVRRDVLC